MNKSQSSLRSVGILTICSFLQLIFQLAIQLVMADQFGTNDEMETYRAALSLPTALSAIFISSIGSVFVPLFIECRIQKGDRDARLFATQTGLLVFAVCFALSLLGYFFSEPFMQWLHPGFNEQQVNKTAGLFRIFTWLTIANGMTGFLNALHHGEKRFRIPAFAGIAGVGATLCLLLVEPIRSTTTGIAWAVLIGSVTCIVLQSKLFLMHLTIPQSIHPAIGRMLHLLQPFILAAAFMHFMQLLDRYLASEMPGSISQLGYAWQIISSLLLLTSGSLPIVAFPNLATQRTEEQKELFASEVAHGTRFLTILIFPICIGLAIFSLPVIRDTFQRGAFTSQDTQSVAFLLVLYLGVVFGGGFGTLAGKVFYTFQETRTPVIISLIMTTITVLLKFQFGTISSFGAQGIAAVTSIQYLMGASILYFLIYRRLGSSIFAGLQGTIFRTLISTGAAVAVSAIIIKQPIPFVAFVAAPCGAVTFFITMWFLKDEFAARMAGYLKGKFTPSTSESSENITQQDKQK